MSCLPFLLLLSFSLIYFPSKLPWAVFLCRTIELFGFEANFKILWFQPPRYFPSHSLHSLALTLLSFLPFWESYCLDFLQFCLSTLASFFPHSLLLSKLQTLPFFVTSKLAFLHFSFSWTLAFTFKSFRFCGTPLFHLPLISTCLLCTTSLSIRNWGHFFVVIFVVYAVLVQYFPPTFYTVISLRFENQCKGSVLIKTSLWQLSMKYHHFFLLLPNSVITAVVREPRATALICDSFCANTMVPCSRQQLADGETTNKKNCPWSKVEQS